MDKGTCVCAGCGKGAEAKLDGRLLCRNHFYDIAAKRVGEHRESLQRIEPTGEPRTAILKFLSELISQTTTLVIRAKFLSPWQREQFQELSLSALEVYKRIQRNPRVPINMPILLYRETGSAERRELTNTVNISKKGACIETGSSCLADEKVWLQKPTNPARSLARVAWVKRTGISQFLVGLDILDHENFWNVESLSR